MSKFKVTYEYRGKVTVEVEAASELQAVNSDSALKEADEAIHHNLIVYDITAKEVSTK